MHDRLKHQHRGRTAALALCGRGLLFVALFAGLAGCSRTSFVSRQYDDFTAYYNKFYNAQRSFKEANDRFTASQPIDRQLMLTVFPISERAATTTDYESAIRKSADVLRSHENSKWVDDALMLIGRAYYNQRNFVSAEQKFREVMALDTGLRDEARYWLVRSQLSGNQYDAARATLEEALPRDDISRKWRPYLELALGELHVREGNFEESIAPLTSGLRVGDRTFRARAQYLLGQVNEKLGRQDEAVEMYRRVSRHKPPFELGFAAQLRAVEVEAVYGDAEAAERALRRMERDDKNYANRHQMAVVRARLHEARGDVPAAIESYRSVIRSQDGAQQPVRGAAHYGLALIYRDIYSDYTRAAAHFDTAATALQGQIVQRQNYGMENAIADPFAPGAIVEVIEEDEVYTSFARVATRVTRLDSLLELGTLDEEAFRARVEEIRQQRIAEMKETERRLQQQNIEGQFNNAAAQQRGGLPEGKVLDYDADAAAAGFLFHKEPVRVQEAFQRFRQKWGDRPLVPGWRVSSNVSGAARPAALADSTLLANTNGNGEDRYAAVTVDVSEVPRSRAAQERMRAQRAIARYEMGNALFLSMNLPDSASAWYSLIIEEDADEPVAARAHYALAQVYRQLGREDEADELEARMRERYPDIDPTAVEEPAARSGSGDELSNSEGADEAYAAAFSEWQSGSYDRAVVLMLDAASEHPRTTAAPRALLAVGTIAGDWARRDSINLYAPLPVSASDSAWAHFGWDSTASAAARADRRPYLIHVYDHLVTHYRRHPSSTQAQSTLAEMRRVARERRAVADSLGRLAASAQLDFVRPAHERLPIAAADSTTMEASDPQQRQAPDSTLGRVDLAGAAVADSSGAAVADSARAVAVDSTLAMGVPAKGGVPQKGLTPVRVDTVDVRRAPVIMDTTEVDIQPQMIGGMEALMASIEVGKFESAVNGTVEVSFVVGDDGRVSQVQIEKGLSEEVDREVLRAVYQARFRPAVKDNRRVAVRLRRQIDIAVE